MDRPQLMYSPPMNEPSINEVNIHMHGDHMCALLETAYAVYTIL